MTHVITRACCNDAACVRVCPTSCIHPTPDDPGFASAEMLHIDSAGCIDCGACVEVCPVDAISPLERLRGDQLEFVEINRRFFDTHSYSPGGFRESPRAHRPEVSVAVIGSGPAAMYAVESLLEATAPTSRVDVFEKQLTPWGLVRLGVAPDHQDTKQVARGFERLAEDARVSMRLGVEVGRHISVPELLDHYQAVVLGTGAPGFRGLDVPGHELTGCLPAGELVAWYNGHPEGRGLTPDLGCSRAVVIGNGNVALDVARLLASAEATGRESDAAPHALDALATSRIEEVVVVGRRGPEFAAFTAPELLALLHLEDVDVFVLEEELPTADTGVKAELLRRAASGEFRKPRATKRLVLRFGWTPVEVLGEQRVDGLRIETTRTPGAAASRSEVLACGLVVGAVGYRGRRLPGLPFDDEAGVVPHAQGRVLLDGAPMPGLYVVGWAKRGPNGVIGSNKSCSEESIGSLLADAEIDSLSRPRRAPEQLDQELQARGVPLRTLDWWRRLDAHERRTGRELQRPRSKLSDPARMAAVADR